MKNLFLLFYIFLLVSCQAAQNKNEHTQPDALSDKLSFDLEKITFNENVPLLFSESLDFLLKDSLDNPDYNELAYYPFDVSGFRVEVHCDQYGYKFQSGVKNKIAFLDSAYFRSLSVITDMDTAMVAAYCETELPSEVDAKKILGNLKAKYGNCSSVFYLDKGFDVYSYEWEMEDRYLQIETSRGFSVSFGTENSEGKSTQYCKFTCLIIKKDNAEKLAKSKQIEVQGHKIFLPDDFVLNSLKLKIETPYNIEDMKVRPEDWGF